MSPSTTAAEEDEYIAANHNQSTSSSSSSYGSTSFEHVHGSTISNSTGRIRKNSRRIIRKRRQQLFKCGIETLGALESFMDTLKSSIESKTDFSRETKKLKQMRKKKSAATVLDKDTEENRDDDNDSAISKQERLWKEIQVQSMTRMICSVYVHTVLYLLLTAQIHLLGGYIFRDNIKTENEEEVNSTNNHEPNVIGMDVSVHKAVLMKTYEYFFDKGIVRLLGKVKAAVQRETQGWVTISSESGLGSISLDDFMQTIDKIREIEGDNLFLDMIRPYEEDAENEAHHSLAKSIIDETLDVMESPVFEEATQESLNVSFDITKSQLHTDLFNNDQKSTLFVHAFGKLKKITNVLYEKPRPSNEVEELFCENTVKFPNIYAMEMYNLDILKELGDISFN